MRKSADPGSGPASRASSPEAGRAAAPQAGARRASGPVEVPAGKLADAEALLAPCREVGLDDEANLNDARLVELARHGDEGAFTILVRRYERKLIRVLARLVRDPETARDLAQETFIRVYRRLEQFDTARRFGPWLFRVGVNLGLDSIRRSRSEIAAPASIDGTWGNGQTRLELADPDPRIRADLAQEVQHILAQLPVSYRTVLVLRDLEGFSTSEVAAIVGRREATVRWRLSQARDRFRAIWQVRHGKVRGDSQDG